MLIDLTKACLYIFIQSHGYSVHQSSLIKRINVNANKQTGQRHCVVVSMSERWPRKWRSEVRKAEQRAGDQGSEESEDRAFTVTTGNRKLRRTATNKPKSRKAHTFSLDWNSRDFLLARTWMWLDTCGVGEGRKTKEEPVTMAMKSPLQLGKARRTLMAAWISRTFFLAKTCMWLDTSIKIKKKKEKKENKKQENPKKVQSGSHMSLFKNTSGR